MIVKGSRKPNAFWFPVFGVNIPRIIFIKITFDLFYILIILTGIARKRFPDCLAHLVPEKVLPRKQSRVHSNEMYSHKFFSIRVKVLCCRLTTELPAVRWLCALP